jgi:general secretion pathway protein G
MEGRVMDRNALRRLLGRWRHSIHRRRARRSMRGLTFIEMMVVLAIIGLLLALVGPQFIGQVGKAEAQAARQQIALFETALDTFRLDVGRYPSTQEGLEALRNRPFGLERWDGPYLKKDVPRDPWGNDYLYRSPGQHGAYDLVSYGADSASGGDGDARDINNWESG